MYEVEALFQVYTQYDFKDLFIEYEYKYLPSRFYLQNKLYFHNDDESICDFIKVSGNYGRTCSRRKSIIQKSGFFLVKFEELTPETVKLKPDFIILSKRHQFYFSNKECQFDGVYLSFDHCIAYDISGNQITDEYSFLEIECNVNTVYDAIRFAKSDVNSILENILKYSAPHMCSKYVFFKDIISCQ